MSERDPSRVAFEAAWVALVRIVYAELGYEDTLREVLRLCAHVLEVERAGFWRFTSDPSAMRSVLVYTRSVDAWSTSETLTADRDSVAGTSSSSGVAVRLDVPVLGPDAPIGWLSLLHLGTPRTWTLEEQEFASAAGGRVATLTVKADRLAAERDQALQRAARAEQLCTQIRDAFAGITLGAGIGLHEAQAIDEYRDKAVRQQYRAGDEADDWQRIPPVELRHCLESLSYFDAEGMRFHLPAFLTAELRHEHPFGVCDTLAVSSDRDPARYALLSPAQRRAVRGYLLFRLDDSDHQTCRERARHALDTYWNDADQERP